MLTGLTVGERSLRKIKSQLPKHLRKTVQELPQRHWIYLDGKTNPIIKIPTYHKEGKVTYLRPPKPKPEPQENETWRQSIPKPKKKPSKWKRFLNWLTSPLSITQTPRTRNETRNQDQEEEEEALTEEIDSLEEDFTPI